MDRPLVRFATERSDGMQGAALGDDIACTAFTLATLRGDAEFKLHFIKAHAGPHMTCDFAVGDSAAYTNDHG